MNNLIFLLMTIFPFCQENGKEYNNCYSQESSDNFNREKIVSIGNLYSYARYFNPNKNLKNLDWSKFLMHTIRETDKIHQCNDSLNLLMYQLFSPLIPDMQLVVSGKIIYGERLSNLPSSNKEKKVYVCEHKGFGSVSIFGYRNPYKSKIIRTKWNPDLPIPDSLYSFPINNDGLTLNYPIAISKQRNDKKNDLKNLITAIDTIDLRLTTNSFMKVLVKQDFGIYRPLFNQDKSLYIASLIEHWAVIKHFYPYLEEDGITEEKINKLLADFTEKIGNKLNPNGGKENMYQYYDLLRKFMSNFNDLHIILSADISGTSKLMTSYLTKYNLTIPIDYIEGSFVFSDTILSTPDKEIKKGDKLIAVNNISIDTVIFIKSKYISTSTEKAGMQILKREMFSTNKADSVFYFSFLNERGDTVTFSKKASDADNMPQYESRTFIRKIEDGIYYLDLSSKDCDEKNFLKFMDNTPDLKHLILDIRNRPNDKSFYIFNYFSDQPIEWGDYRIPIRYFPNQKNEIWKKNEEKIMPKKPVLNAKLYALTNENAISYGESVVNMLKKNKLALLIGENTSGTNGDASYINLPLFAFIMSIGKDFDGYHGKGVEPDIVVKQNLEDYKKGRDTVLEYVVKQIRGENIN